jgi:hypothetical protein
MAAESLVIALSGSGRRKAHMAEEMSVSRETVAHWVGRFETEGETGLHDRSSRPHSSPARTRPQLEQQVVELCRDARRGQDWIGPELGVPAAGAGPGGAPPVPACRLGWVVDRAGGDWWSSGRLRGCGAGSGS